MLKPEVHCDKFPRLFLRKMEGDRSKSRRFGPKVARRDYLELHGADEGFTVECLDQKLDSIPVGVP